MNDQGRKLKIWLRQSNVADRDFCRRIMYESAGKDGKGLSFMKLIERCTADLSSDCSSEKLFGALMDVMDQYLSSYPAPPSYRQKVYQKFFQWASDVGEKKKIPNYEDMLGNLYAPINKDPVIGLIQELHPREGITKDELSVKYGVSQRVIQANLHRLDSESDAEPFRIAGQSVKVPVKRVSREDVKVEDKDRRWRFYTPDTLNPVIFQCNIMQTATLLKSFFYNYRDYGNLIPFDMAVDVWIQLSDYAKDRIQEIFGKQDNDFLEFLTEIEDSSMEELHYFHTEDDMNSDMQVSESERLNMAYKGGKRCKVWIAKERKWLYNRKIKYDFDRHCYYAVCYTDPYLEEKIYLTDQDRIYY